MYRENMKIYEEMDKKKGKLKKDEEKIEDFVRSPKWLIQADSNTAKMTIYICFHLTLCI